MLVSILGEKGTRVATEDTARSCRGTGLEQGGRAARDSVGTRLGASRHAEEIHAHAETEGIALVGPDRLARRPVVTPWVRSLGGGAIVALFCALAIASFGFLPRSDRGAAFERRPQRLSSGAGERRPLPGSHAPNDWYRR
jgi:hypothetical protein